MEAVHLTREIIKKEPWFGEQRAQVLALLERAEKAETTLVRIAIHAYAWADSKAPSDGLAFLAAQEMLKVPAIAETGPVLSLTRLTLKGSSLGGAAKGDQAVLPEFQGDEP